MTVSATAVGRPSPLAIVVVLALLLGLQPVTTDLYLPALPALTADFGASMGRAQLTLSALMLAFGISQLVMGPVADRFGRRPVLVGGLTLYAAASAGSVAAASIEALVGWRMLQGIGMAAAVVCARARNPASCATVPDNDRTWPDVDCDLLCGNRGLALVRRDRCRPLTSGARYVDYWIRIPRRERCCNLSGPPESRWNCSIRRCLGRMTRRQPVAQTTILPLLTAESGLTRYLEEIRRFPMLQPQEEYMLAKRWREHGDRDAAHKLVTSHLRLVAKIAMGYRGYGLPISEVISEGNVGLMQAVKRFEPEKGFRLATYAMWWIKAAIQEYILRSWSLVKMGTTANQKKLFFNLRKAKSRISALEEGDMRPDQVKIIARRLGVTEQDVVDMNRRLSGDASLNAPIREEGDSGEWQDWLVDDHDSQEKVLAESEEFATRRKALSEALSVLNDRERRIFEARRLADEPVTLEELADEFGVSRERVRQIEVRAFEKVQKAVRTRVADMETPAAWTDVPTTSLEQSIL